VVMAETDELTCDLLPATVTGRGERAENSTAPSPEAKKWDFQSLATEVVVEGIRQCSADATNLHSFVVDRVEKELIAQVLASCNYVQTKAATRLGINRNTLHKKMKDYSLDELDPNSHPFS
jgi:DNA-binding protein Fis